MGKRGLEARLRNWGCFQNAMTKKPNNVSSDRPWQVMKIKCRIKNKGCCIKPHFYPQGMEKGNINHAPKKPHPN